MFKLRFPQRDIKTWASRYQVPVEENRLIDVEVPKVRSRGHIARSQFLRLCRWKTPRSAPACRRNSESLVIEATRVALGARSEELKIGALRVLAGVEWPTASVILHLCDRAPYPILDVRALWSVGISPPPSYSFAFWWSYTEFVRSIARRSGCTMRDVDRALWQYSMERQNGA